MVIQKANIEDAPLLTKLTIASKAYWGYSTELMEIWQNDLTITEEDILKNEVYILKNGICSLGYYSILKLDDNSILLDNLFVSPNFIGNGCGKLLISDCIEKAKDNNVKRIILDSDPNAKLFYASFGFVEYNQVNTIIEGRNLPQMELIIEE